MNKCKDCTPNQSPPLVQFISSSLENVPGSKFLLRYDILKVLFYLRLVIVNKFYIPLDQ